MEANLGSFLESFLESFCGVVFFSFFARSRDARSAQLLGFSFFLRLEEQKRDKKRAKEVQIVSRQWGQYVVPHKDHN